MYVPFQRREVVTWTDYLGTSRHKSGEELGLCLFDWINQKTVILKDPKKPR
jgi:hypothetical protein